MKVRTFVYQDRVRIFYVFRANFGKLKQNKGKIGLQSSRSAVSEPVFLFASSDKIAKNRGVLLVALYENKAPQNSRPLWI